MYRTSSCSSSSYGETQDPFLNPNPIFISSNQAPQATINGGHYHLAPHSYSSSFPSNSYNSYLHRSDSSQSLPINHYMQELANNKPSLFSSSSHSSSSDFLDFCSSGPVRRVFSAGDLQGMNNGSQVSGENSNSNSNQEMIGTGKVVRYSAEERKERIEKYRNKRNHRNFQKKITYACRKTLADSRPRVKGRFARNGELETETEADSEVTGNNTDRYNYNGCNNFNNYNSNEISYNPNGITYNSTGISYNSNGICNSQADWWRQIEETLEAEDEGESSYYDEQMWALSDVLSMNLLS